MLCCPRRQGYETKQNRQATRKRSPRSAGLNKNVTRLVPLNFFSDQGGRGRGTGTSQSNPRVNLVQKNSTTRVCVRGWIHESVDWEIISRPHYQNRYSPAYQPRGSMESILFHWQSSRCRPREKWPHALWCPDQQVERSQEVLSRTGQ